MDGQEITPEQQSRGAKVAELANAADTQDGVQVNSVSGTARSLAYQQGYFVGRRSPKATGVVVGSDNQGFPGYSGSVTGTTDSVIPSAADTTSEYGHPVGNLGRVLRVDPRSAEYPVVASRAVRLPDSKFWRRSLRLDQGSDPYCGGFAATQLLACEPVPTQGLSSEFGERLYRLAQTKDDIEGEYRGTSLLGVCEALLTLGYISEYRWPKTAREILAALQEGPILLGCEWTEDMQVPSENNLMHPTGDKIGLHIGMISGYDRGFLRFDNTFGSDWADNGSSWLRLDEVAEKMASSDTVWEVAAPIKVPGVRVAGA